MKDNGFRGLSLTALPHRPRADEPSRAAAASKLMNSLVTLAPPKNRETERAKAVLLSVQRFGKSQ